MKKAKNDRTNCCVYGCSSRRGAASENLHFHKFPRPGMNKVIITNKFGYSEGIDRRNAWDKILVMGKPSTQHMRVCSRHFISNDYINSDITLKRPALKPRLKRTAVPSRNLPQHKQYSKINESTARSDRLSRRNQIAEDGSMGNATVNEELVECTGDDETCESTQNCVAPNPQFLI